VHQACLAAVAAQPAERGLALYSFGASFPEHPYPRLANADDPADLVVDVTPVLARKIAASLCHRSQHALFVRRRSQEAGRPLGVEEVVSAETREGVRRQWPAGPPGPGDRLARWLGL
jgi:LmbE family N-acetylglucosaminyl deacetylase